MGAVNIYFTEKDTESSKHMNRCSTSLTIREIKLKTQLTFTTHQLECLKLKQTKISDANSGKYEEKWDPSFISRSNIKCCSHSIKQFIKTASIQLPYDSAIELFSLFWRNTLQMYSNI